MVTTITTSQIDKAVADYRALLEKHSGDFSADAVHMALSQSEFAGEQFNLFRRYVEALSNLITRKVKVNRNRSQQEALDATNRTRYTDRKVVDNMPKGEGEEVEIVFFKPDLSNRNGFISDDNLEKEFELRGLKPADPYTLAALNEADPTFADEKPHSTHWKDAKGNWCYATFNRWCDRREVRVYRYGSDWSDDWWFAGVRK